MPGSLKVPSKPKVLKYGTSLRGPCGKNEGLVFHCTARVIRLINSLLDGRNENIPSIPENFPKNWFSRN